MTTAETQVRYARIAGAVYLLLIVLFMGGVFVVGRIGGAGGVAQSASAISASETLYRIGLVLQLLASAGTVVLAYGLYVIVRPVDADLATLALCWRLGEAVIGAVTALFGFAALAIYTQAVGGGALGLDQWQSLLSTVREVHVAAFNVATLFFSFGSTLFFLLLLRTEWLPKALAGFGVFASVLVTGVSLGYLVVPRHADIIRFGWAPIFIAEIAAGFWLLLRAGPIRHGLASPRAA